MHTSLPVISVYSHTYVVVIPQEHWEDSVERTTVMLSMASVPEYQVHNYVELSTFPNGEVNTTRLLANETLQFNIDVAIMALNATGEIFVFDLFYFVFFYLLLYF